MTKVQTLEEKRAAADAARNKATEARSAADATPDNADLEKTAKEAEAEATRLETEATAPSHETESTRKPLTQSEKIKKRMEILRADLRSALIAEGKDPDAMSDEEIAAAAEEHADDEDSRPATIGDLKKRGIIKTAETMVSELTNPELRQAVAEALKKVDKSLPAEERFSTAVSIASSSKNAVIAREAQRMGGRVPQRHGNGGGTPPRDNDANFKATPLEEKMMKDYKLSQADILKSRREAAAMNFGPAQGDDE